MMLTAITLAAALTLVTTVAADAAPGDTRSAPRPANPALPPLALTVLTTPAVSPALLSRTLAEADTIWRAAGVTLDWRLQSFAAHARIVPVASAARAPLRVIVDDSPGKRSEGEVPIGWIVFDENGVPQPELHVSRGNAITLLGLMRPDSARSGSMPPLEIEVLLGRAMGRALAHELGHYLFASKTHTRRGLMQGVRSATEMFAPERVRYEITEPERRAAVSRIWDERRVAQAAGDQIRLFEPYVPAQSENAITSPAVTNAQTKFATSGVSKASTPNPTQPRP